MCGTVLTPAKIKTSNRPSKAMSLSPLPRWFRKFANTTGRSHQPGVYPSVSTRPSTIIFVLGPSRTSLSPIHNAMESKCDGFINDAGMLSRISPHGERGVVLQRYKEADMTTVNGIWNLVCLVNDIPDTQMFTEIGTRLDKRDSDYFESVREEPDTLPPEVDVGSLLKIDKKVGLVCPVCFEKETMYKLYANRSADEGMTACCTCRACKHTWNMRM